MSGVIRRLPSTVTFPVQIAQAAGQLPVLGEERGKAAPTELFEEARNDRTPILVERVVNDIDEVPHGRERPGRRLAGTTDEG